MCSPWQEAQERIYTLMHKGFSALEKEMQEIRIMHKGFSALEKEIQEIRKAMTFEAELRRVEKDCLLPNAVPADSSS